METGSNNDRHHTSEENAPEPHFLSLHTRYGSEVISVMGPDNELLYESASIERILGYRHAEEVSSAGDWFRYVHPEDMERLGAAVAECMATPGEHPPVHYRIQDAEGNWRWLESRGINLFDDPGIGGVVVSTYEITGRKNAEEAREESEHRLESAFEDAPMGIAVLDLGGKILAANQALCGMLGHSRYELTGCFLSEIVHPEDRESSQALKERLLSGELRKDGIEKRLLTKAGGTVSTCCDALLSRDRHGEPEYLVCNIQDIAERKRAEKELNESERRFRQLFEQSVDAMIVHDEAGNVVDVNHQASKSLGYGREELLSMNVGDYEMKLLSEEERRQRERSGGTLWQRIAANEPGTVISTARGENRRKDGTTFPVEVLVGGVDYGGRTMILSSIRDVTERRALEERLEHQALHDPLTGLPGRELLIERLRNALARTTREGGSVAALFVDVDNLKLANDSLGHETGDRLLCRMGEHLRTCVGDEDTVARISGDEFVVVHESLDTGEALLVASHILRRLEKPLRVGGYEVSVSASIGISTGPYLGGASPAEDEAQGPQSAEDLIRNADTAMYRAKSSGGGGYAIFEPEMGRDELERLELSSDLHRAIERGELRTYYQHKVDLSTGKVAGWEALLRWDHPERGTISPETFIPLAEENGLIVPIGKWVLEQACEQARIWRERYPREPGEPGQFMSVNLSAKQFADPGLEAEIGRIVELTGLPAEALDLEITERVLVEDEVSEFERIRDLKRLGLTFSLDDFGTGYSSLASLKQLPVDCIKIDRYFVSGLPGDPEDEAFVAAIVSLARALGLTVVAEGIEAAEQWSKLSELGCDYGQGYYFSLPLPVEEASRVMDRLEAEHGS